MTVEPLPVLVNSRAGRPRPAAEAALARSLAEHHVTAVIEAVVPGELARHLERLAGMPMVGVAGGDGTQRTAARILAGSGSTLVPFPTGRLNHFARRLGLGTVGAAVAAVRTGRTRTLPVGRANGHVFMNTAIAGSYPGFVRVREALRPFLSTWPAAGVAAGHMLATWPRVKAVVRFPGAALDAHTALVWVGVGRGSYPAIHEAPLPAPGDGLEVVVLPGGGRFAALALIVATARHRLRGNALERTAHLLRVPWLQLEMDHPVPLALDGEPRLVEPPVTLRYQPGALRVITA